jgi:superfamily I DNA/RNA helicase
MTFLDPAQTRLAQRSFNGPARISGATGTGKTCVGLYRAAHLARTRPGIVLYTTHLRTLPWVLRQSLRRMAPDVADRVEFAHVRALASRVLRERGMRMNVDLSQAEAAMDKAWYDVGAPGLLGETGLDRGYWREEIDYVIKGRGITTFAEYAELARTGRRYRLTPEVRRAVWDLFEAYRAQLDWLGVHDDLDAVALADAELQRVPQLGRFSAVIVDEAQDLTLAMVRMLSSFVGDAPDGLTLIGDVEQALCPGGYTLAEAGISLAGRGAVLDVNYRSTAQILDFTSRFVSVATPVDGSGTAEGGTVATAARSGSEPVVERCATEDERGARMVAWTRSLVDEARADAGDIAVLCMDASGVARAMDRLMRAGVPVLELSEYGNDAKGAVRVGTVERAKGLEFRHVVMGDVATSWLDAAPTDDVEQERQARRRRDLYVGMSRARDGLWVGVA